MLLAAAALACGGGRPGEQGLRDSFAAQLAANRFVSDFQRTGDDLSFVGPGPEGDRARWRVHIDSAGIAAHDDPAQPFRGTVRSSWYADGEKIEPAADRPTLPFELTSNGLSQDCWAFWVEAERRWSWE